MRNNTADIQAAGRVPRERNQDAQTNLTRRREDAKAERTGHAWSGAQKPVMVNQDQDDAPKLTLLRHKPASTRDEARVAIKIPEAIRICQRL
jgi:hypothetical protein